ncbi:MAG TPA: hypothetical protein VN578_15080 [Candidatus Binatia bacterium]|jgi:hypothetical protein|nr:hypothetical protein [Candidatus Binatia bacterium]
MTDWNIQSRAHACEACSRPFADKEAYHTLLFDEKAAFRRIDICQSCWQRDYSDGARDRKGFVSYWQGVYEAPAPRTDAIQKDTAESLLRKLIELNEPRFIPAAFILAVMLERKRLLKIKEQIEREGHRVFIYEQVGTGDVFTIIDPKLQLNQLETVQHDVAALLEHGLHPPAPSIPGEPAVVAATAEECALTAKPATQAPTVPEALQAERGSRR